MINLFWKSFKSLPSPPRAVSKMSTSMSSTKLSELRKLMFKNNLSAYYIPSEDSHQVKIKLRL